MTAPSRLEVEIAPTRRLLTPTGGYLSAFSHTLNPYAGCAFGDRGCGVYCYVAESPIGRFAQRPWGQWLRVKTNAAEALRRELERQPRLDEIRVFMSSATDPYQPAESQYRITRSILEVFRELPVGLLLLQTRSPLVERDLDLLAELPFVWLSMTVETDDDEVRRALTPTCPSIERRFAAMRRARALGIAVQAAVSPVLPHHRERLAGLIAEAADRAVVDTFTGDGATGQRTARRPLPARFAELGYGDWRDERAARALHEELRQRLGEDRVGWSVEGFNTLAEQALTDAQSYVAFVQGKWPGGL